VNNRSEIGFAGLITISVFVTVLLPNRNHTPMRHFAHCMFELDGGVVDAEVVVEAILHLAKDPLTSRRWDVGNRNMTR